MAYISFKVNCAAGLKGVIVRKMLQDDPTKKEHGLVNQIDPELLAFVELWLSQGNSISRTPE